MLIFGRIRVEKPDATVENTPEASFMVFGGPKAL
jgi:hypothetical protein